MWLRLRIRCLLVCATLGFVGCSGGDGSGDSLAPEAHVLFPVDGGAVESEAVTVVVMVTDDSGVAAVHVSGVAATFDSVTSTWRAGNVPLAAGATDLVVRTEDVVGNVDSMAAVASVERQGGFEMCTPGAFSSYFALDWDPVRAAVVASDTIFPNLFEITAASGERRLLAHYEAFSLGFRDVAVDVGRSQIYVAEGNGLNSKVIAFDRAGGTWAEVSGFNTGSGPNFFDPAVLVYEAAGDRLMVLDLVDRRLISVDPATGARAEFSSAFVGTGPPLIDFGTIVNTLAVELVMTSGGRLFVVSQTIQESVPRIVEVDPATGNRSLVTSTWPDTGRLRGAMQDPATGDLVLFVERANEVTHVVTVDPDTGSVTPLAADVASPFILGRVTVDPATGRAIYRDGTGIRFIQTATGAQGVVSECPPLPPLDDVTLGPEPSQVVLREYFPSSSCPPRRLIGIDLYTGLTFLDWEPLVGNFDSAPRRLSAGDPSGDIFFVAVQDTVTRLDPTKLQVATVSAPWAGIGSGNVSVMHGDIVVDPAGDRAWVGRGRYITLIDLDSGDRVVVSGLPLGSPVVGAGPLFSAITGISLDPAGRRLFVADIGEAQVGSVDLEQGERTVVWSSPFGLPGLVAFEPHDVAWDARRARIIVADKRASRLLVIEEANGQESIWLPRFGSARLSGVSEHGLLVAAGAFGPGFPFGAVLVDVASGDWCLLPL